MTNMQKLVAGFRKVTGDALRRFIEMSKHVELLEGEVLVL